MSIKVVVDVSGLFKVVSIPSFWLLVTPAALLGDPAL